MTRPDKTIRARLEGRLGGLPYDVRWPTAARLRSRAWNPGDPHLLTPKTFGWGYGINVYWLVHPRELIRVRRRRG